MDMQGNRQLSTTQQQAWDALNDAEILKACIPGCEKFELSVFWGLLDGNGVLGTRSWCSKDLLEGSFAELGRAKK